MEKPRKPGTFKPGQSANPGGRPKSPPDLLEARKLTRFELERILNKYVHMTKAEIVKAAQDPNTTALELMVSSLISKGVNFGDYKRISFLLDRLGFVVPKEVNISGADGGPIKTETVPSEQLKEEINKLLELRKMVDEE